MMQWFRSFSSVETFKSDAAADLSANDVLQEKEESNVPLVSSSIWREPLPIATDDFNALLRMEGFKDELLSLRSQWVHEKELRVVVGTWNLAGLSDPPPDLDIREWLALEQLADVYVLGFEEIVPLSTGTMLGAVDTELATRKWEALVREHLNYAAAQRDKPDLSLNIDLVSEEQNVPTPRMGTNALKQTALDNRRPEGLLIEDDLQQVPLTPMAAPPSPGASLSSFSSSASIMPSELTSTPPRSHASSDLYSDSRDSRPVNGIESPGVPTSSFAETEPGRAPANSFASAELKPTAASVSALSSTIMMDGKQKQKKGKNYYSLVASKQMVGIHLCIWVRSELRTHVHGVQACSVPTALMGFLGNKGAVAVSLCIHETSLCFVCAHLTAGEDPLDVYKRSADFAEIMRRTAFIRPEQQTQDQQQQQELQQQQQQPVEQADDPTRPAQLPSRILEHDRIFFLGDLNYRLDLVDAEARLLISQQDWDTLAESDQLRTEMRMNAVFDGWQEGPIYFAPTYKYMSNSSHYVGDFYVEGEKRRTPAWTDRILWRLGEDEDDEAIKLLSYNRSEIIFSDHRPVGAVFLVGVEAVDPNEFQDTIQLATSNLDARQRFYIPQCSLNTHSVDFGSVGYAIMVRQTVELTNEGQVAAKFSVKVLPSMEEAEGQGDGSEDEQHQSTDGNSKELETSSEAKQKKTSLQLNPKKISWMDAEPKEGMIPPAHTVTISLHAWVVAHDTHIDTLIKLGGALESILVVSIEGGGDLFVSCSGSYVPSSWGLRLEWLAALGDRPVRNASCCEILLMGSDLRKRMNLCRSSSFTRASGENSPSGIRSPPGEDQQGQLSGPGHHRTGSLSRMAPEGTAGPATRGGHSTGTSWRPTHQRNLSAGQLSEEGSSPRASVADSVLKRLGSLPKSASVTVQAVVPKELERMISYLGETGQDVQALFDLKGLGLDLSWLDDDILPGVSLRLPKGAAALADSNSLPGSPRKLQRMPSLPTPLAGTKISLQAEVAPIRECLDTGEEFPPTVGVFSVPASTPRGQNATSYPSTPAGSGVPSKPPLTPTTLGMPPQRTQKSANNSAGPATPTGTSSPKGAAGITNQGMAKALVSFLLALPEPIIPEGPAQWEIDASDAPWQPGAATSLFATTLKPLHLAVMEALLNLVQMLLRNRIANRLAVQELAVVFAAILFKPLHRTKQKLHQWSEQEKIVLKRRVRYMHAVIEETRLRGSSLKAM